MHDAIGLMMNTKMATKRVKNSSLKLGERCTDFQLHKSQLSLSSVKSIIDYTENKLRLFIQIVIDKQQKETLTNVLEGYRKGEIAIAWKAGRPVWLHVTKD